MASFKAKIRWERLRKSENKKNHSDEFHIASFHAKIS